MNIIMTSTLVDMVLTVSLIKEEEGLSDVLPSKRLSDLLSESMVIYPEVISSTLAQLVTIYQRLPALNTYEYHPAQVDVLSNIKIDCTNARQVAASAMIRLLGACADVIVPGISTQALLNTILPKWSASRYTFGDCCLLERLQELDVRGSTCVTLEEGMTVDADFHDVIPLSIELRPLSDAKAYKEKKYYNNVASLLSMKPHSTPLFSLAAKELGQQGTSEALRRATTFSKMNLK